MPSRDGIILVLGMTAAIGACSVDDHVTDLNPQSSNGSAQASGDVATPQVEYVLSVVVTRYSPQFGALIDSSRIRFTEYEDGYSWKRFPDDRPPFRSGTTLDGAAVQAGGPIHEGGWSADPNASYLTETADRTRSIDRALVRDGIRSLPNMPHDPREPRWNRAASASPVNPIPWRSPALSERSSVPDRLETLRSRSTAEERIGSSQIRFELAVPAAKAVLDIVFDEDVGDVVERSTTRDGVIRSILKRDYQESGDSYRLIREVLHTFADDGESILLRVERSYLYL